MAALPAVLLALHRRRLARHPVRPPASIPAGLYGTNGDIPTFGSRATLVASAATDARVVAALTKAIFAHVPELRTAHPVLAGLSAEEMTKGLTAPLHPAAAQVYKELGLLR